MLEVTLLPRASAAGKPRYQVDGYSTGLPAVWFKPKGLNFGTAKLLMPDGSHVLVRVDAIPMENVPDS